MCGYITVHRSISEGFLASSGHGLWFPEQICSTYSMLSESSRGALLSLRFFFCHFCACSAELFWLVRGSGVRVKFHAHVILPVWERAKSCPARHLVARHPSEFFWQNFGKVGRLRVGLHKYCKSREAGRYRRRFEKSAEEHQIVGVFFLLHFVGVHLSHAGRRPLYQNDVT